VRLRGCGCCDDDRRSEEPRDAETIAQDLVEVERLRERGLHAVREQLAHERVTA
jgi:hypothetical protein